MQLFVYNADITCTVAPAIIFYNVYEPFNEVTEDKVTKLHNIYNYQGW